jgi:hypothetical protein
MFPSSAEVASFISACVAAGVAFKATAGLHHPVRGSYPLTYDADAPQGVMHGFLNVMMAAVIALSGDSRDVRSVLDDAEPALVFTDSGAAWRGRTIDRAEIARARRDLFLSFGSCSFDEPAAELRRLGLL